VDHLFENRANGQTSIQKKNRAEGWNRNRGFMRKRKNVGANLHKYLGEENGTAGKSGPGALTFNFHMRLKKGRGRLKGRRSFARQGGAFRRAHKSDRKIGLSAASSVKSPGLEIKPTIRRGKG